MNHRTAALLVRDLVKCYGEKRAVAGVSFAIEPGEIFGLLGPNGAGKTTIISMLVTLQKPTSGSIHLFEVDVLAEPRFAKQWIGFVPQELIHYGFFTVTEILRYHATYYGLQLPQKKIDALLEKLHLDTHKNRLVNQLSGGMKRRLLLAKALLHRPKLLLLDEPTAGVDVALRATLWQLVRTLKEEGISVLLTTHYLEEAERLCDRIGILHRGELLRVDRTEQLLREHSSKKVTLILAKPVPHLNHPLLIAQSEYHLDFQMPNEMPFLQVLREASIPFDAIRDVNVQVGTLEDVMQKMTCEEEEM